MPSFQSFSNIILPGEARRRQRFFLSKAKLARIMQLATFMAGFSVRSIANLQINADANDSLLTLFTVITALLAATSCFVIVVAMWVLPLLQTSHQINENIMSTLESQQPSVLRSFDLQKFASAVDEAKHRDDKNNRSGEKPATSNNTLGLKTYRSTRGTIRLVEIAWILAGTVSVFLFILDVIAINWVKFRYFTWVGAMIGTSVLVFVIIGLGAFGLYFRLYFVRKFRNITKKLNRDDVKWAERNSFYLHNRQNSLASINTRDESLTHDMRQVFPVRRLSFRTRDVDTISVTTV